MLSFVLPPFIFNFTGNLKFDTSEDAKRPFKSNIKSEVNKMLENLSNIYSKYQTFKFSYKSLTNFLKGEEDKAIIGFKLYEESGYGIFKDKESYFVPKVISILFDINVLVRVKNDKGYENINLSQNSLSDSQVLILEQQFYW